VIVSAAFVRSTDIFARKGKLLPAPRSTRREASTYAEYGLTDAITGIAKLSAIDRRVGGAPPRRYDGVDYGEAGIRARLWQGGPFVLSVQSTLRIPGASDISNPAQAGHTGFETDWRAQAGANFPLFSWQAFATASLGYRTRSGGPADEYRGDLTLGVRPPGRWLWLFQSFSTLSAGHGRAGFAALREHKLQSSLVYTWNEAWSLQVGTVNTVAGRNTPRDVGAFAAVWRSF